ncbi:tyrosine-protein phosphatase non-receptor type 1 isoform X2 [Exaiptasia diaphana]|uniref:protein-tyrosine-phosphatase n=1 Tax=Exaiptasia diaphana TaxID=2652724 RepID=A0A913X272_EXADI|nr:tyrosine-protein phosphatase non-receptor type 1 isoform X2 [Exaiptasia diaphana]
MLAELDELDSNSGWVPFFQKINWIAKGNAGSQKIAKLPENRQLNRYRDVLPYDHSRIILNAEDGGTDYINANLVEVPSLGRRYILCQGPLKHTSAHFWQMVWEQNTKAVIMLNRVIEKNQIKCYQYWPCGEAVGHTNVLEFGNYRITYIDENMSEFFTVKTLELYNIKKDEKRTIYHFHYLHWPDFGVPSSPATFLSFLFEARNTGVLSNDVGPAVIHCSAGIGRSGTYVMVDCILKEVEKTKDLNGVDIKKTLLEIRTYRLGLIQTPDQLRFTYAAILEGTHQLFPEVYEEALDKFMEMRGDNVEEEEEEEPPPLPPPRKRPEPQPNDTTDIEKKRRRSLPETPSETNPLVDATSQATLSSDESDGEDEIINLSESSLSEDEDETNANRVVEDTNIKDDTSRNVKQISEDSGTGSIELSGRISEETSKSEESQDVESEKTLEEPEKVESKVTVDDSIVSSKSEILLEDKSPSADDVSPATYDEGKSTTTWDSDNGKSVKRKKMKQPNLIRKVVKKRRYTKNPLHGSARSSKGP